MVDWTKASVLPLVVKRGTCPGLKTSSSLCVHGRWGRRKVRAAGALIDMKCMDDEDAVTGEE